MPFSGFAVSVRGASHEKSGAPCQDSARVYLDKDFAIAAVADGHGSERHFRSECGSEMATRVGIRSIIDFRERNGSLADVLRENPENAARRIAANIIYCWNHETAAHLKFLPLTAAEKSVFDKHGGLKTETIYGSTLIIAYLERNFCFGLQIGDGSLTMNARGITAMPVPADDRLVGNRTTSLCDSDAIGGFRHFVYNGQADGIALSSDGLINSFLSIDDFISFSGRYTSYNGSAADLAEHLRKRSETGSSDDISFAAVSFAEKE
ncbi:MAG: protein phosphatase 2C domain-containing protein [Oscillospiraceae bacterium]